MTMILCEVVRSLRFLFGASLAYCLFEAHHQNRRLCSLARMVACLAWADTSLRACSGGVISWALVGEVGVASSRGVFV